MESICVDITINKRKWGILFAYRAPNKIIYLYIYIIYILYIYYIYIYIYIYILRELPYLHTNFYRNLIAFSLHMILM